MADKIKSPIAIFIILIVVSLSLAGAAFLLLRQEKATSAKLQEELEGLKVKQNITEAKLQEYKNTISQLELKLKDAQTNIDTLTGNLEQEASLKQEALNQIEQLKIDLEKQKQLRSDLESKFNKMQKSAEDAQAKLKELESKKTELEEKLKTLEAQAQSAQAQGVELGTIVVGSEGKDNAAARPAQLEGKVLVVNKDYNFAVINLGSKDGLNVGDIFSLYHNNEYIGDIKVEKVHDSMSAADFVSVSIKDQISEGDKAVKKD